MSNFSGKTSKEPEARQAIAIASDASSLDEIVASMRLVVEKQPANSPDLCDLGVFRDERQQWFSDVISRVENALNETYP